MYRLLSPDIRGIPYEPKEEVGDTHIKRESQSADSEWSHPLLSPQVISTLNEMGLQGVREALNPESGLTPDLSANVVRGLKRAWNDFHHFHSPVALPLHDLEKVYKIPAREQTNDDATSREAWAQFSAQHPGVVEEAAKFASKKVKLNSWSLKQNTAANPNSDRWFDTPHPYFNALTRAELNPPERKLVTPSYAKELDDRYGVKGFVIPHWSKLECHYCHKKGHIQSACTERVEYLRCESRTIHRFVKWLAKQQFPKLSKQLKPELQALCDLPKELEALRARAAAFKRKWTRDTGLSPDIFTEEELTLYPQYRRGAIWYWMAVPGVNRSFLVDMVQGYRTKTPMLPESVEFAPNPMSEEDQAIYAAEVARLRADGVLLPVPQHMVRYVHPTFIVHGKKPRTVVNAAPSNHYIPKYKFRLHTNHEILMDVPKGYWTFSWDVKDAFYTAYQHPREAVWNCISIEIKGKRRYFAFTGRPMGKSDAPFDFCRAQTIIERWFNSIGIRIKIYMDDQLGYTPPFAMIFKLVVNFIISVLNLLHVNCKVEKTHFKPGVTAQPFVGLLIDTERMRVSLTERKILKIQKRSDELLALNQEGQLTIKKLAAWYGILRSTEPAISNTAILALDTKALFKDCHVRHDLVKRHNFSHTRCSALCSRYFAYGFQ